MASPCSVVQLLVRPCSLPKCILGDKKYDAGTSQHVAAVSLLVADSLLLLNIKGCSPVAQFCCYFLTQFRTSTGRNIYSLQMKYAKQFAAAVFLASAVGVAAAPAEADSHKSPHKPEEPKPEPTPTPTSKHWDPSPEPSKATSEHSKHTSKHTKPVAPTTTSTLTVTPSSTTEVTSLTTVTTTPSSTAPVEPSTTKSHHSKVPVTSSVVPPPPVVNSTTTVPVPATSSVVPLPPVVNSTTPAPEPTAEKTKVHSSTVANFTASTPTAVPTGGKPKASKNQTALPPASHTPIVFEGEAGHYFTEVSVYTITSLAALGGLFFGMM